MMTSPVHLPPRSTARRRLTRAILLGGLALVGLYAVLSGFHIGEIGAPTDIGGGLILLIGYVLITVALARLAADVLRGRRARNRT